MTGLADATPGSVPQNSGPVAAAVHSLENETALDALVAIGERVAAAVTADPSVRGLLRGEALGHALHPFLVEVPMGTWISAALLDALGGDDSRESAALLTGVGILAAVPAAVTGWAEFGHAGPKGKRVAVVHAVTNVAGLGLQVASYAARRSGNHRAGAGLAAGAMGLVGLAGYLGGHLAAARKVGSHDPSFGPEGPAGLPA